MMSAATSTGSMKRRVRFDEPESLCKVVCEITPLDLLTAEDYDRTWYSSKDYDSFKRNAKLIAKEIRRYGRDKLLDGAMHNVSDAKEDNSIQNMLVKWSRQGFSCRGLERWIHVSQGKLRKLEQRRTIKVVLEVQQREKQNSQELLSQQLRAVSEHCSASARSFAHKMGIADATAIFMERSSRSVLHRRHRNNNSSLRKVVKCSPMA
jgi:hypothetical protein